MRPAIVMADADLTSRSRSIKAPRVINTGQVCNCADRVYVDRRVADEFTEQLRQGHERDDRTVTSSSRRDSTWVRS